MADISIQRAVPAAGIPAAASLRDWALAALGRERGELSIRIVGDDESRSLNRQYRGKDKPTNVLSFHYGDGVPHPTALSADGPPLSADGPPLSRCAGEGHRSSAFGGRFLGRDTSRRQAAERVLGDLVICAPVVAREAREQGKAARAHWAHMVVHGCLHLLGHDHENERDAVRMEALETRILTKLGFPAPYGDC